jgi:uncharacterized protein (TIGR02145 family)
MKSTVTNSSNGSGLGWNPAILASPGTDTSGFSALPGGYRGVDGSFNDVRDFAFFWSATEDGTSNSAGTRLLSFDNGNVFRYFFNQSLGASVRCLRD